MIKFVYILLFFLTLSLFSYSQENKGHLVELTVYKGDTIPIIHFREVYIFPKRTFKNEQEAVKYRKLIRNVKRVYPYAKLAEIRLAEISNHIATLNSEAAKRAYAKKSEKEIKEEFEEELKKLTLSQGKLLIKLIDRQTGDSSYELVKDIKGSLSAFMWQSVARLFGSSLKVKYDPKGKDKLIEEIVLRYEHGQL